MSTRLTPPRKLLPLFLSAVLLAGIASFGRAADTKEERPAALDKPAPESLDDLKAIQKQVHKVVDKMVECTVNLQVGKAQGSGVIISEDGYVLTAGHVSAEPDKEIVVVLADGKAVKGKTLGVNNGIDSGLIKIAEPGKYPFAEMGVSSELKKGQWCIVTGHPGGLVKGRSPVVRLGRVLDANDRFVRTDCTLVGGDSGGPLWDLDGKVIGINSRIGGSIAANIHVPVDTFYDTWDRLSKSESWGGGLINGMFGGTGSTPDLGFRVDLMGKEARICRIAKDSPAEKAGLKVGDVVKKFGEDALTCPADVLPRLRKAHPGDEVTLEVQREKETLNLKAVVGKR
jgi:serine protease Do